MSGVAVRSVKVGPGGLVVVSLRLEDGTVRRLVLPKKQAGVAQIEWAAQALNSLTQIQNRPR